MCYQFIKIFRYTLLATSRSTSPSSRLRDNYPQFSGYRQTGTVPKKNTGIPRSLANSRETSPSRATQYNSLSRRNVYGTGSPRRSDRPPLAARPVQAQKMLQQSRDAENALVSAFVRFFSRKMKFFLVNLNLIYLNLNLVKNFEFY